MPNPPLSRELAEKTIAAVNEGLKNGGSPRGSISRDGNSAINMAATSLGEGRETIDNRLRRAKQLYGIEPDWKLWHGRPAAEIPDAQKTLTTENAKLRSELRALKSAYDAIKEQEITRDVVRQHIFKLSKTNPEPPTWLIKESKAKGTLGVPTLFLSDWHWGEVVNPSEIGGVNAFNLKIAHKRARHTIDTAIQLLFSHLQSPSYPGIVLPLGGDMISGDIHEELTATNEIPVLPSVHDVFGALITVIDTLADKFGAVFVPCVTGNHGRNTKKIQSKERHATNFDWLIYCLLAKHYEKDARVKFMIPDGPDCYWNVYGHRYMLTHGDQFRGGDGLIGPIGPLTRGRHKKASRDASMQRGWDTMLCGHFHTLMQLPHLIVNGSLKGLDEYAFQGNFGFERPAQALWVTHPKQGITFQMPVYCEPAGTPEQASEWVSWKAA